MYETGAREPGTETFLELITATGAAVSVTGPSTGIDCYRNAQVFTSLTSVLGGVPIRDRGPLEFPASLWAGPS